MGAAEAMIDVMLAVAGSGWLELGRRGGDLSRAIVHAIFGVFNVG